MPLSQLGDLEHVVEEEEAEVGALAAKLVRAAQLHDVQLAQEAEINGRVEEFGFIILKNRTLRMRIGEA